MSKDRPVILLTRPKKQSERFAVLCQQALGDQQDIIQSPVLRIEFLPLPAVDSDCEALIFSSENGVAAYVQANGRTDLPAYCVGERTAKAADAAGLRAHCANGSADDLVKLVQAAGIRGKMLHIHGEHTRGDIAARLGGNTREVVGYRQIEQPINKVALAALAGTRKIILPMFSPRTAELFFSAVGNITAPLCVVSMSEAVKNAVIGSNLPRNTRIETADTPDAAAMLRIIKSCIAV